MYEIYLIQTFADKRPRWKQSVDFSGTRYRLYISWNTRLEAWFMTILDRNDTLLLGGIRLVPEIDLFAKYKASVPALPPGILRILDRQGDMKSAELTRDNLGTRFVLSYTEYGD